MYVYMCVYLEGRQGTGWDTTGRKGGKEGKGGMERVSAVVGLLMTAFVFCAVTTGGSSSR